MNQVRHFRESIKLTQQQLAAKSNCTQATISAIESGSKTDVYIAQRIARVLKQPIEKLFPDEKFEKPKRKKTEAA